MKYIFLYAFIFFITTFSFSQEIKKEKLNELLQKAKAANSEAVIIYQKDGLVAEKYFGIGHKDTLIEAMSTTKSIAGIAVACLLDDNLIDSLDVPVYKYYPEWKQGNKQYITIRHLVNMTSGIQNVPNTGIEIYPSPDFVQLALAAEVTDYPGIVFSYNNKAVNLLAGIIKKVTGKRMDEYIKERLFKPLGIDKSSWSLDDAGNPQVFAGCQIKPADHIKMGLLLLNKGKYNGNQVIAEKNIKEVVTPCRQYAGYGMLWWIDYEQVLSIIDDEIIDALVKANISPDFINKVKQLKGEYNSEEAYRGKIISVFGENPWGYIDSTLSYRELRLRKKEFRGNRSYRADGYLGNYIIVDPAHSIVALRMTSYKSAKTESDFFPEFKNLVLSLTK